MFFSAWYIADLDDYRTIKGWEKQKKYAHTHTHTHIHTHIHPYAHLKKRVINIYVADVCFFSRIKEMKHIIKLVTDFVDVCRCLGLCLRTFVSIRVPPRGVCSCSVRWDLANLSPSTWGWEGARTPPYLRRSFASRLRSSLAGRLRAIPQRERLRSFVAVVDDGAVLAL